ncbi:hypothetical protein V8C86DRAFT_2719581 [Haematococcus lacustris]
MTIVTKVPCGLDDLLQLLPDRPRRCEEACSNDLDTRELVANSNDTPLRLPPEFQVVWPPCAILGEAITVEARLISTLAPRPSPGPSAKSISTLCIPSDAHLSGAAPGGPAQMYEPLAAPLAAALDAVAGNTAGKTRRASLLSVVGTLVQSAIVLSVPVRGVATTRVRVCEREACVLNLVAADASGVPTPASIQQAAPLPVLPRAAAEELMGLAWNMMCEALPEGTELPSFNPSVWEASFGTLLPCLQNAYMWAWSNHFKPLAADINYCLETVPIPGEEHEVEYRCVLAALVSFLREHDCWACLSCLLGGLRQRGLELLLDLKSSPAGDWDSPSPQAASGPLAFQTPSHLHGAAYCQRAAASPSSDLSRGPPLGPVVGSGHLGHSRVGPSSPSWLMDSLASCTSLMLDSTEVPRVLDLVASGTEPGSSAVWQAAKSPAGCGPGYSSTSTACVAAQPNATPPEQCQEGRAGGQQPSHNAPFGGAAAKASQQQVAPLLAGGASRRWLVGLACTALWLMLADILPACIDLLARLLPCRWASRLHWVLAGQRSDCPGCASWPIPDIQLLASIPVVAVLVAAAVPALLYRPAAQGWGNRGKLAAA